MRPLPTNPGPLAPEVLQWAQSPGAAQYLPQQQTNDTEMYNQWLSDVIAANPGNRELQMSLFGQLAQSRDPYRQTEIEQDTRNQGYGRAMDEASFLSDLMRIGQETGNEEIINIASAGLSDIVGIISGMRTTDEDRRRQLVQENIYRNLRQGYGV